MPTLGKPVVLLQAPKAVASSSARPAVVCVGGFVALYSGML